VWSEFMFVRYLVTVASQVDTSSPVSEIPLLNLTFICNKSVTRAKLHALRFKRSRVRREEVEDLLQCSLFALILLKPQLLSVLFKQSQHEANSLVLLAGNSQLVILAFMR
jgi:hypothetical protein